MSTTKKDKKAAGLGLLRKWLDKIGVEDYTQLSEQERVTYNEWEKTLTAEFNADKLATFLKREVQKLNKELREAVIKGEERQAILITGRLDNYEAILATVQSPDKAREALVAQISNLIRTN
jgi:hypothetical protein